MQRAQQPGLRLHRHVADLVEEQRPAGGLLELAEMPRDGTGESALLVAEQLALDQFGGNGCGVDRDERSIAPTAQLVDRLCDQFLAGAGFAEDQHGQVVAQHTRDHAVDRLHRRTAADQRQSLADRRVLDPVRRGRGSPDRLAYGAGQFVDVEGLGEIFESTGIAGAHCGIERILRREDDDRHCRKALVDHTQRLDPVTVGELDVGHQRGKALARQLPVTLGDVVAMGDAEALGLQRGGDDDGDRAVVLDEQDVHRPLPPRLRERVSPAIGRWRRKCVQPLASSRS